MTGKILITNRTFGWIQDPGRLEMLRRVVEIFCPDSPVRQDIKRSVRKLVEVRDGRKELLQALSRSPLQISYKELTGSSFTPRRDSRCNGIIQATVPGQKRPFIGDWPADNFLRWAHAFGFVRYLPDDKFEITESGIALSRTRVKSDDEYRLFADAMLAYPPAVRVLNLLLEASEKKEDKEHFLTKFAIGDNLGFRGERGFTHISETFYVREYLVADNKGRKNMRDNWEGDSDKYARMICSWMMKLKYPWVRRGSKFFGDETDGEGISLSAYALTRKGHAERKRCFGTSSVARICKFVPIEMLCTKGAGRDILRRRRALVLQSVLKRTLSVPKICEFLARKDMVVSENSVIADLGGLENIGLNIKHLAGSKYKCADTVRGVEIPQPPAVPEDEILQKMEKCREKLMHIPRSYVELVQMGFEKRHSVMFEIKIMELLTEWCGYQGRHLGGPSRPDGVAYHDKHGLIIDTKSYKDGFNIPVAERDKMMRYVGEVFRRPNRNKTKWWKEFPDVVNEFTFLFVSGKFIGNFREQLKALAESTEPNVPGAAVAADTLLLLADKIAAQKMSQAEFKKRASCLDEMSAD